MDCTEPQCLELHCFYDGSTNSYGNVCYLRYKTNDSWKCSFVFGKARVASIKTATIPRLKLAAAVTAVKLSNMTKQELNFDFNQVVFRTDSTLVIQYIANETKRFKTYVANRLALMCEHTEISQWRYLNTDLNPADLFSRGLMPTFYQQSDSWLQGPTFLFGNEDI